MVGSLVRQLTNHLTNQALYLSLRAHWYAVTTVAIAEIIRRAEVKQ